MIDTTCLKHASFELTAEKLSKLGATEKAGRRNPTWHINPLADPRLPRITVSQPPDGVFHVFAECSVPRLLYGHNARLCETEAEVMRGLELMCAHVESVLDIPFPATSAVIWKLHLTRDYYLGDAAHWAVFPLFNRRLQYFPHRNLKANEKGVSTLYFNYISRKCVICIYDKHSQVIAKKGSPEAQDASQGKLRIEFRANKLAGIRVLCKRFNAADQHELLTQAFNDRLFRSIESELHFPDCIHDRESPIKKLRQNYSPARARSLAGFCEERRIFGDAELTKSPSERRNFNIYRRNCERAGVFLDLQVREEEY